LERVLGSFFESIVPPIPGEEFDQDMEETHEVISNLISSKVRKHIEIAMIKNSEILKDSNINQVDKEVIYDLAKRVVVARYGYRTKTEEWQEWLESDYNQIGLNIKRGPTPQPLQPPTLQPLQPPILALPPQAQSSGSTEDGFTPVTYRKQKRRLSGSSSSSTRHETVGSIRGIETQNSFEAFSNAQDEATLEIPTEEVQQTSPEHKKPREGTPKRTEIKAKKPEEQSEEEMIEEQTEINDETPRETTEETTNETKITTEGTTEERSQEKITEGTTVETSEGTTVGTIEGTTVETSEGTAVGTVEGTTVETSEGTTVGTNEGTTEETSEETTEETTAGTNPDMNTKVKPVRLVLTQTTKQTRRIVTHRAYGTTGETRKLINRGIIEYMPQKNKTVYNGKMDTINLKIEGTPSTIVFADYEMLNCTNIPEDWEVHIYPGANLSHATKLLESNNWPKSVKNVVIAVGTLNAIWTYDVSTVPKMNTLIRHMKSIDQPRTFYVGITGSSAKSKDEELKIGKINKHMQDKLNRRFINPPPAEVSDTTTHTSNNILSKIITHLN
jgi:hypothetical protein